MLIEKTRITEAVRKVSPANNISGEKNRDKSTAGRGLSLSEGKLSGLRVVSIDAFRGFTILAMLLVNNKAPHTPVPAHLTHASWSEGLHFADLIFPWFIFLAGVVIPIAGRRAGEGLLKDYYKVLKRSAVLVLLGCLINSSYAGRPMFDFGVLQLIGFSYFFASVSMLLPGRWRGAAAAALLAAHWAAIRFIPIPNVGAGVFTEEINFIRYMNENYFEPIGMPGVLSVATTTALAIIGTLVGEYMKRQDVSRERKAAAICAAGAVLVLGGWLWNLDLPFVKKLWTSSYVVFAAGWGAIGLGLFYYIADVKGLRRWTFPFVVFGMNALVIFVLPVLVNIHFLREWTIRGMAGDDVTVQQFIYDFFFRNFGHLAGGWMYLSLFVFFWWMVMFGMYRKKIFIRA